MTSTETAGDERRAAALILHHARGDVAGITAVLTEADRAGRATQLILAVCNTFAYFLTELRTEAGQAVVQQAITRLAGMELTEEEHTDD